jgi:hypothetical protein
VERNYANLGENGREYLVNVHSSKHTCSNNYG